MDKFESRMDRMEERQKRFEEETRNNFADIKLHLENITDRNILQIMLKRNASSATAELLFHF